MQTDTDQKTATAQNRIPKTPPWDKKTSFTLGEVAAFLEVRSDDLTATLPTAGIDLNTREDELLTRDDVKRLEHLVHSIRHTPPESVYGVGDL